MDQINNNQSPQEIHAYYGYSSRSKGLRRRDSFIIIKLCLIGLPQVWQLFPSHQGHCSRPQCRRQHNAQHIPRICIYSIRRVYTVIKYCLSNLPFQPRWWWLIDRLINRSKTLVYTSIGIGIKIYACRTKICSEPKE